MLNQTRALWGIARESILQGPGIRGIKSALGGYRTNASADFQIFFCSVISQRVAFGQSRVRRRRALTLRGSFPAVKCCAGGNRALGR